MSDFGFKKAYEATIDDADMAKREVVAVISTDAPDREGDILLPKGLRRKNYQGLTVDFNHDKSLPIGTCRWVKAETKRVLAKYRVSDATDLAKDVFNLLADGTLRFHSVDGCGHAAGAPTAEELRLNKAWQGAKRIVRDWELYNFAVCTVPVNPEAETLLVQKGLSPQTLTLLRGHAAPPASPAARVLNRNEVLCALLGGLTSHVNSLSVDGIVHRALGRAAGRIE